MINSFLVTLHNNGTQPVNASSTVGDVLWPDNYLVKAYTGGEAVAERILFDGLPTSDFNHFLTAIHLLWVVEESVLADRIVLDDPRISYNTEQLVGQFEDTPTHSRQQVSRILDDFESIQALQFLEGDLLNVYRSSLSFMDKLAAVICYFGQRDG